MNPNRILLAELPFLAVLYTKHVRNVTFILYSELELISTIASEKLGRFVKPSSEYKKEISQASVAAHKLQSRVHTHTSMLACTHTHARTTHG